MIKDPVQRAWYERNAERQKAKARAYYKANKAIIRARSAAWRKKNRPRYLEIMAKVKNRRLLGGKEPSRPKPDACECCGGPPLGHRKGLCLDHDHENGEFRGWICTRCNLGIGHLGDNLEGLQRAIGYLLKTTTNGKA